MSSHSPSITTEEEFKNRLDDLVTSARTHDIDVEGAWSCAIHVDRYDYEVLVSAVDSG